MNARAAALAWSAVALAVAGCNPQPPKRPPSATPMPSASALSLHVTGHGTRSVPVRIVQQRGNRVQYVLIADSFESRGSQGKTRAVFSDARVTFHDRHGGVMTATAPQAIVDEVANTITLRDDVHARNGQGMKLRCDLLVYDRATELLDGWGHVVVTDSKGFRATGSRFDSDISFTHLRMR